MAYVSKYVGRIPARGRSWLVQVLVNGYAGELSEYPIGLDTHVEWGINKISSPIERRIIASSLAIVFVDPQGLIFSDFNDPATDLSAYVIRIEDSTCTYRWTGFPKLNTAFHPTSLTQRKPETSLLAYDGLVDLKDGDAILSTNLTFHGLLKQLLVDGLIEQPIEYVYGWRPSNVGSTGAVVDKIRITDLSFHYEKAAEDNGRAPEILKRDKQLADLLAYMDANVYQTLRGKWRVAQRWLSGLTLSTASRAAALYDHLTDSISEVEIEGGIVAAPDTSDSTYALRGPVRGVRWIRGLDDKLESLDDTDWIRGGEFTTSPFNYWDLISGGFSNTTIGISLNDNGTEIRQKCLSVAEAVEIYVAIDFNYALEYTPGGSGDHLIKCEIRAVPFDDSESVMYASGSTGTGTWTTTPTQVSPPLSVTPDANGTPAGSLTTRNFLYTLPKQPFPFDGYIEYRVLGDTGTDYYLHCDDFIGKVQVNAADPLERWESRFLYADEGEIIEIDTNLKDIRYHVDPTRGANPTFEADVSTLIWQVLAGWEGLETASEYKDLAELVASSIFEQAGAKLRFLRTSIPGIVEPSDIVTFQGARYNPIYISLVLHTEVSFVLAIQNLKEVSV